MSNILETQAEVWTLRVNHNRFKLDILLVDTYTSYKTLEILQDISPIFNLITEHHKSNIPTILTSDSTVYRTLINITVYSPHTCKHYSTISNVHSQLSVYGKLENISMITGHSRSHQIWHDIYEIPGCSRLFACMFAPFSDRLHVPESTIQKLYRRASIFTRRGESTLAIKKIEREVLWLMTSTHGQFSAQRDVDVMNFSTSCQRCIHGDVGASVILLY